MESVSPPRSGSSLPTLLAAALAAAGGFAYANGLSGPFVFDDRLAIVGNPTLAHFASAWRPLTGVASPVEGRPVLNLSFALNYALGGLNPVGYHALNVGFHVLGGLTLFGIIRRIAGPARTLPAFFAALLWTVHPLQTEAVSYVSQRAESLLGLFYLFTIYGFVRAAQSASARGRWAGACVASCCLGMATKEAMATAPLIVFLFDRTFVSGNFRAAWRRHGAIHSVLAATWLVLAGLVAAAGWNRSGSVGFGTGTPWIAYVLTQFPALVHYLWLAVWPHPLAFEYGTFWIRSPRLIVPDILIVTALAAATAWALRVRPAAGFFGAAFFLLLAPTSLVPGTTQMIVEHRMYLPLAAAIVPAVWLVWRAAPAPVMLVAGGLAAAALTTLTRARNGIYASEIALWSDTVATRPDNEVARDNLGNALKASGRLKEAIDQYEAALRIDPSAAQVHNNLGAALHASGRLAEAVAQLRIALQLAPEFPEARDNLADACNDWGTALCQQGRPAEAIPEYNTAIRLRPNDVEAENNLGNALDQMGQVGQALGAYEAALRLAPDNPDIRRNLEAERTRARP